MPLEQMLTVPLAEGGGLIARKDHPALTGTIDWALRRGLLTSVLPGIYAPADRADDVLLRVRAAKLWDPDAVVSGAAAAQLTFWPALRVTAVDLCTRRRPSTPSGFRFQRRSIPPELILDAVGHRLTHPALTALDLCASVGGDGIDQALRTRAVRLVDLHRARELSAHRHGMHTVRRLLHESRDEPWSGGERRLHRLLHTARITGWRANHRLEVGHLTFFLDIAFPVRRLAIEVDGRIHQEDRALFQSDRWRQNWLTLAGWRVLRFTWLMLNDQPDDVLRLIREGLALPEPAMGHHAGRLRRFTLQAAR